MVLKFRGLIQPFMLRTLNVEVEPILLPKKELYLYVGMTALQRQLVSNNLAKRHFHN